MLSNIADFYKSLKNDRTILSYIGELSSEDISAVMQELEEVLLKLNEQTKVRKKLYNVMIEVLQNLYHHADDINSHKGGKSPNAVCVVDNYSDQCKVTTANYINNDKIESFSSKLEKINLMSKEELKEYYLQVLNNGEKSTKDGAGLGMIEISRKIDDKLHFEFVPLDNNYSLFVLKIKILK